MNRDNFSFLISNIHRSLEHVVTKYLRWIRIDAMFYMLQYLEVEVLPEGNSKIGVSTFK